MREVIMEKEKSGRRSFVRIRAKTIEALGDLRKDSDLDIFRHTAREVTGGTFEVQGLLSETEIREIRSRGYEVEVVSDADEIARQRLNELRRKGKQ